MQYNFSDIDCNKKRTKVILEFSRMVRTGNRSAREIIDLRVLLVKEATQ